MTSLTCHPRLVTPPLVATPAFLPSQREGLQTALSPHCLSMRKQSRFVIGEWITQCFKGNQTLTQSVMRPNQNIH